MHEGLPGPCQYIIEVNKNTNIPQVVREHTQLKMVMVWVEFHQAWQQSHPRSLMCAHWMQQSHCQSHQQAALVREGVLGGVMKGKQGRIQADVALGKAVPIMRVHWQLKGRKRKDLPDWCMPMMYNWRPYVIGYNCAFHVITARVRLHVSYEQNYIPYNDWQGDYDLYGLIKGQFCCTL